MSKFCMNCGTQLADDVAFCHVCGAVADAQAAPQAEPQQTYAQPQQTYAQSQQTYTQPQQTYTQPQQTYTQPQQTYTQPYAQPAPAPVPAKGFAIAGMVCGIVSFFILPLVLGALGIIFGALARYKGNRSGMATAGIVCGVIGIALWLIMLVACAGTYASFLAI